MQLETRIVQALSYFDSLNLSLEGAFEEVAAIVAGRFKCPEGEIPDYSAIVVTMTDQLNKRVPVKNLNRYGGLNLEEFNENYLIIYACIFAYASHLSQGRHYRNIYDFLGALRAKRVEGQFSKPL